MDKMISELFDWMYYRQHVFYIFIGILISFSWMWQNWLKLKEIKLDGYRIRAIKSSCGHCRDIIWESSRRK